jgi:hypothetical protein
MLLSDRPSFWANCLRVISAGSFAAEPVADTESPCASLVGLGWFTRHESTSFRHFMTP